MALDVTDLGRLHVKPIREQNGAIVLVSVLALPASQSKLTGYTWQSTAGLKIGSVNRACDQWCSAY